MSYARSLPGRPARRAGLSALAAVMFLGLFTLPLAADEGEGVAPVTIPNSRMLDIDAAGSGKTFRLMIWEPRTPAPPEGYPVIYLLDGNAVFGTAVNIVDFRSRAPRTTGIEPAVIVGIGYPTDEPYDLVRRSYDLTPSAETYNLPERPNKTAWPPVGGADEFLAVIENDVKPLVGDLFPVDRACEILIGHSFGGLFALHTLFTQPDAFDVYIAGSPSIWFNDRHLMREVDKFADRVRENSGKRNLFIGIGEYEQDLSPAEARGPEPEKRRAWKEGNRMVDNARDMAAKLRELEGPDLQFTYTEFEGEDHSSVVPALLARGLGFAFAPEESE